MSFLWCVYCIHKISYIKNCAFYTLASVMGHYIHTHTTHFPVASHSNSVQESGSVTVSLSGDGAVLQNGLQQLHVVHQHCKLPVEGAGHLREDL